MRWSDGMTKPFLNFRPSIEMLREVELLGETAELSNAEITRQLCQKGLEELRKGRFEIKKPHDRRKLRTCGEKIKARKTGGKMIYVGAMDQTSPVNISSDFGCDQ